MKKVILIFMILGSYAGSAMPLLWGESMFSFSSILLAGAGGILGIWIGYKAAMKFGIS